MSDQFDKQRFLTTLTSRPGIYRMLDATGRVLYVGKARDLKKRVASYFGSKAHHPKTQALMSHTTRMDVTVTATEQEALLLEYNLIKAHEPRFNVLLRDGKSYPYIRVTLEQKFPRFEFHRGKRVRGSRYFGPFPSAGAVRQTLGQLQKLFMVRQCQDSYFANRSRPCLQHQIKRCTAPCVNLIERDDYQRDVDNAVLFLSGQDEAVVADLISRMESASEAKIYEQAALFRDQIKTIREVQARQSVSGENLKDADVAYVYELHGAYCIAVIMIRGGRMLGGRNFFPRVTAHTEIGEVLSAFLMHHYFAQAAPPEIMLNVAPEHRELLEEAFAERAGHGVHIKTSVRGHRRRWLDIAGTNAREALKSSQAYNASTVAQLESIGDLLQLDETPDRLECFDISHTSGNETVASCVVFGREGAIKSAYRRFNIKGVEPGDDYAAIAQVVQRRYARLKSGEAPFPDLIIIDGGAGQLSAAGKVMEDLQLTGIPLIGVAKGQGRKAGREKIYRQNHREYLELSADSPALHLLQQIRDEAHRFAITGHRQRRNKAGQRSTLELIPGLGPARRKSLLREFGGLQGVKRAGLDDLTKVPGISDNLAHRIYDHFHGGVI